MNLSAAASTGLVALLVGSARRRTHGERVQRQRPSNKFSIGALVLNLKSDVGLTSLSWRSEKGYSKVPTISYRPRAPRLDPNDTTRLRSGMVSH